MGLRIRDATPSERVEAARQWVTSYCPGAGRISIGSPARTMRPWLWQRMHRGLVDALLDQPDCHVVVAVLSDRPLEPLGWACWTDARVDDGRSIPTALHYVYVVDAARRHGIGSALLARVPAGFVPSHETASGAALLSARLPRRPEART